MSTTNSDASTICPVQEVGGSIPLEVEVEATTTPTSRLATNDDEVQVVEPTSSSPVTHPVAESTMEHFDGETFKINGMEYSFDSRGMTVDVLRRFCMRNNVRSTDPDTPGKSLRREKKPILIEEIKKKHERRVGGQEDPWKVVDKAVGKKPVAVNLFRLANVVFSDKIRDEMLNRGKCLEREDLDVGLKTDQQLFEKMADEYNKKGISDYDDPQYICIDITGSNLPSNYTPIKYQDAKVAFKQCTREVENCRQNQEKSGTNDSDAEEPHHAGLKILPFTNKQYVTYWNLFAEDNQQLFSLMIGELKPDVYNESSSSETAASSKQKKKKNEVVEAFDKSTAVSERQLAVIERQVIAMDRQSLAISRQSLAVAQSLRLDDKRKLTEDRRQLKRQLNDAIPDKEELKRRRKAHEATKNDQSCRTAPSSPDSSASADSNASLFDELLDVEVALNKINDEIKTMENEIHKNDVTERNCNARHNLFK